MIINQELKHELINKLSQKAKTDIIIVEGPKDAKALNDLGIEGDFFLLKNNGKSLQECAEQIARDHIQAVLCLDSDKKGKELTRKMKTDLEKEGVKVDTRLCRRILKVHNSNTVEGISSR